MSYTEGKRKLRTEFQDKYKASAFNDDHRLNSFDDGYVLWLERKLVKAQNEIKDCICR